MGAVYTPVDGSAFALLTTGLGQDLYSTLSQTFTASAGDAIHGWAFFDAGDYLPFNDDGYVRIKEGNHVLFSADVAAVGEYSETPWTAWAFTLPTAGSYTLEAGVRNRGDNGYDSFLGLDDIRFESADGAAGLRSSSVAAAPEPGSMALLAAGALGLFRSARRRKQGMG
jgi:hypothetical protein